MLLQTANLNAEQSEDYYATTIKYNCTGPNGCPQGVDPSQMTQEQIDAYNAQQQADYQNRLEQADQANYQQQLQQQQLQQQQAYDQYQQDLNNQMQQAQQNSRNMNSNNYRPQAGWRQAVGPANSAASMATGMQFAQPNIVGPPPPGGGLSMSSGGMANMAAGLVGMLSDSEAAQYTAAGLNGYASVKHYQKAIRPGCCTGTPSDPACCAFNVLASTTSAAQAGLPQRAPVKLRVQPVILTYKPLGKSRVMITTPMASPLTRPQDSPSQAPT
ncbi:MAG: hypothetical protein R2827_01100 [Bdellovibrionales bacterium]